MSDNNVDEEPKPKPDYEVGYGRPPKSTQFKPGQSGNPKGRKRKPKSVQAQMQEVLSKKVTINEGGIVKRLPMQQVILRNLASKAAKGDLNATKFVFTLLHSPEHAVTDTIDETGLSSDDQAMFHEMIRQLSGADASDQSTLPTDADHANMEALAEGGAGRPQKQNSSGEEGDHDEETDASRDSTGVDAPEPETDLQ